MTTETTPEMGVEILGAIHNVRATDTILSRIRFGELKASAEQRVKEEERQAAAWNTLLERVREVDRLVADLRAEVADLTKQRDELLEALKATSLGLRVAKAIFLKMEAMGIIAKTPSYGNTQSDRDLALADAAIAAAEKATAP